MGPSAAGVGEGRLAADLSNITAAMKMLGPGLLGSAYFWGAKHQFPAAWGIVAAAMYMSSQLVFFLLGASRPSALRANAR